MVSGVWPRKQEERLLRFPRSLSLFPSSSSLHICSLKLNLDCGSFMMFSALHIWEQTRFSNSCSSSWYFHRQAGLGDSGRWRNLFHFNPPPTLCFWHALPGAQCPVLFEHHSIPLDPFNTIKYKFKKWIIDFFFSDYLLWLAGAKEYFLRKKLIIIRYNYIVSDWKRKLLQSSSSNRN